MFNINYWVGIQSQSGYHKSYWGHLYLFISQKQS